jgi:hypothetical protein
VGALDYWSSGKSKVLECWFLFIFDPPLHYSTTPSLPKTREKGLAIHKLPERLEVMKAFPQLADGQKVDKITLKKKILEKITPALTLPLEGEGGVGVDVSQNNKE